MSSQGPGIRIQAYAIRITHYALRITQHATRITHYALLIPHRSSLIPPMSRRPPLAEVDATSLAAAVRARQWRQVAPWGALLAGFALVLAGMISFFWLSAEVSQHPEDRWLIVPLAGGLAWFLWRRFGAQRGFALALIAPLAVITAAATLAWLAYFEALHREIWLGLLGLIVLCLVGIGVG